MKVSLNWAQQNSNVDLNSDGVDNLVKKIGAQLGAVESIELTGPKYDGVLVVKVVSCEKHPNADKLSVCWVDDGEVAQNVERNPDGHVQVVCGAPNVRVGLTAAWLPPGSTVPNTADKEPFILGSRELRGTISNGMLASPSELAMGDSHAGILEIDTNEVGTELTKPGTPFRKLYGLDDVIIDIENKMFTHRPDCFGVLGVAREIAGIQQQAFVSPQWYLKQPDFKTSKELELTIINEVPDQVPRFMAVAMQDTKIKPSPTWLQAGLARVGIKSINNIVDITNYLMYVTGQPLHAYDYDKVAARSNKGAILAARLPSKGETVALLNGKILEPRPEAIMIATDKKLIGVGGVMGGADTEVDDTTKNIIIECANFDMYSIRRTSMAHGLFTDAVTRFNKGQSPLQNDRVIAKAMKMMEEIAGAKQASNVIDDKHLGDKIFPSQTSVNDPINIESSFINARLGLQLNDDEIIKLLSNVEFDAHLAAGQINVMAPFWRTDIAIAEDIVEEVGRLCGFDKLPLEMPKRTTSPTPIDPSLALKQRIRTVLASFGSNEVLTYSFVHGRLIEKAAQNKDMAYKLSNALSPDLQYYRLSLTPSLLAQIHPNIKAGHDSFSLFEINKTPSVPASKDDAVPGENTMISLVTADKLRTDASYYTARVFLDKLAETVGVKLTYTPITEPAEHPVSVPFEPKRSALVMVVNTGQLLGIVGEYKQTVAKALKLPSFCAGFEIDLDQLLAATPQDAYTPLSRYPSISQDICLEVDASLSYGKVTEALEAALENLPELDQTIDFQPIDIYQAAGSNKKRVTYRLTLTSYERTLTEGILSAILDKLAETLQKTAGAKRI